MTHNFFDLRQNSYSIVTNIEEVMGHYSQRKITGLDQSFLKGASINCLCPLAISPVRRDLMHAIN